MTWIPLPHNLDVNICEISTTPQICLFLAKGMVICTAILMFGMAKILDALKEKK